MKHYDYVEWLFYKKNLLTIEKRHEMEQHLYSCDLCMEIFLSLIDEEEIRAASEIVPKDFNQNIMGKIKSNKVKKISPPKKATKYPFGFFVAVASVTIVLTLGGFFTNLVDTVPNISASISTVDQRDRPNRISDLSQKIVNGTSEFIGSIENIERNKEEK
ncbi:MAG: hypothetical protein GX787_06525 [Tissierellia bacterium]|nr:hypothetical protein [Tissierellia bacterium]